MSRIFDLYLPHIPSEIRQHMDNILAGGRQVVHETSVSTPALLSRVDDRKVRISPSDPTTTTYITLKNGVRLPFTESLVVDFGVSGLGGLQSGLSLTKNTWYYIYAQVSGSDLAFITTDKDPSDTPFPNENYRYVGPVYINSNKEINSFEQNGRQIVLKNTLELDVKRPASADKVRVEVDLNTVLPKTVTLFEMNAELKAGSGDAEVSYYYSFDDKEFDSIPVTKGDFGKKSITVALGNQRKIYRDIVTSGTGGIYIAKLSSIMDKCL